MDAGDARGGIYHFDRFTLDLVRGALSAAGGTEVALRPKAFALLSRLVENAGRLMEREEIMRAVWPGVVVTEDSITQCVREIRRALGDEDQRLLRTLPRRGFLFAAEVSRADSTATLLVVPAAVTQPAEPAPPRPPSGRPVVAVLPFENIGGDPEQGYFADGLTADLTTDLTRLQSFHVVRPRGEQRLTPDDAPRRRASYLVSGSVRSAGGRVRVTARLEEAGSGVQLWAERFDRPQDDLFAVQEELASGLAARLLAQVEQEGMRLARSHPPASLDAYDLCLRGRELHGRGTEADTLRAREMFGRAIAADPGYAAAYAWQSYTVQRGMTHWWGEPRGRDAVPLALDLAQRAVKLDPDSPFCAARLSFALLLCGRWDEALATAAAAVRLNPYSFESRHGSSEVLIHAGDDPEAAVRETRFALSLDPFHPPGVRAQLGRALLLAGRPEEALAELRWVAGLLPDYGPCYHTLVTAAVEAGHLEEARAAARQVMRIGPHWTMRTIDEALFFRHARDRERFHAAYRLAGLPEG